MNWESNMPIIRIEIEGMKRTLCAMLHEHAIKLDASLQEAVNDFLKEENIKSFIKAEATKMMKSAITKSIEDYFIYGEGSKAIKQAVDQAFAKTGRFDGKAETANTEEAKK